MWGEPAVTDQEPEPALKDQSNQDHAADIQMHSNAIANLLKRGHTIDRLSSTDLTSLVAHIDQLREHRDAMEPRPEKRARSVAQLIEASPPGLEKGCAGPAGPDHAGSGSRPAAAARDGKQTKTKEERRKRLHARFMRFSRSLTSPALNCSVSRSCYTIHGMPMHAEARSVRLRSAGLPRRLILRIIPRGVSFTMRGFNPGNHGRTPASSGYLGAKPGS